MKMKRMMSAVLSLAMVAAMGTAALAEDTEQTTEHTANQVWNVDNNLNKASSKMTLEVVKAGDILVATVPVELPFVVNTKGEVTVPENAKIVNNSDKSIKITEIRANLQDKDSRFIDNKETLLQSWMSDGYPCWVFNINNVSASTSGGSLTSNFVLNADDWTIQAEKELPLTFDLTANKYVYKQAHEKQDLGTISFTIAYAE